MSPWAATWKIGRKIHHQIFVVNCNVLMALCKMEASWVVNVCRERDSFSLAINVMAIHCPSDKCISGI